MTGGGGKAAACCAVAHLGQLFIPQLCLYIVCVPSHCLEWIVCIGEIIMCPTLDVGIELKKQGRYLSNS